MAVRSTGGAGTILGHTATRLRQLRGRLPLQLHRLPQ